MDNGHVKTVAPAHKPPLFLIMFAVSVTALMIIDRNLPSVKTLTLLFSSIVLEALPFMLVGALVGGMIEEFVSRERMAAILERCGKLIIPIAAAMGLVFPVCECAVVPVVKRLSRKGLPPGAAVAYLLGGPIVNPVVAFSTAVAFRMDWQIAAIRLGTGYLIAISIAYLIDFIFRGKKFFVDDIESRESHCSCGCHDHKHEEPGQHHDDCGCGSHEHDHASEAIVKPRNRFADAIRHATGDFVSVAHYLVIGAFIAAAAQSFINRDVFASVGRIPGMSILLMIVLAILLNLCSEADAFIAASFRAIVPLPALMAFMLVGPMFDIKLLLMYRTLFRTRAIKVLSALIIVAVIIASFIIAAIIGTGVSR